MSHRVGQQLGNYRLIHFLGQGSFAEVYLGEHVYLKTRAAIKVLRLHLPRGHEQDFLREAQTLAHLEHPHIVRILDFGVHEGMAFLVMQYALDGTLRMVHPRGTILSATTVLSYLKPMASALQYAHDRLVIHRDVKPENMLLGQDHQFLLSDFGLAVVAHSSLHQQNVAGTLSYMAPEQLKGYPCTASDQYALGVVVYEWLCGNPPFSGSPLEVATQHLLAAPLPLRERNPALSSAVEQVVLTALAKEPGQRFAHITDFAVAFEQAIQSEAPSNQEQQFSISAPVSAQYLGHHQHQPLVGRAQERACLRDLLRETEQQTSTRHVFFPVLASSPMPSRTASAFLLGDAGIGKTRLAEEMGQEAQQGGWGVVRTCSYIQERHIPYQVWIEVLRHITRQGLWQPQVERLSSHLCQALATLMPEYTDLFLQEEYTAPTLSGVEPLRIWEAVFALLVAVSRRTPLLILLDDLHWADVSSIELLGYLARRLVDSPVLVVGTGRESELPPGHALPTLLSQLQRERLLVQLYLPPLTDAQIGKLVSHLPEPLVASVQQQAAGNPFFAEELGRACLAQRRDTGNVRLSPPAQQRFPLPETVADVLDQHLSKLSRPCQQLLRSAAVLGGSFSFSTLALLHARRTTTEGDDRMLHLLEEALEAKILLEEGSGTTITYHFRHPLMMGRLYETLSETRRGILHRQVAETLRTVYATREEEGAALITYHLVHSGADPQLIAHFAERAGNYAYLLAAYPEAERHYRLALEQRKGQQSGMQETQQEQVALTEAHHHQTSLLEQIGECLSIQGHSEEARHCYEQALEIWSQFATTDEIQQERELLAMLCIEIGQTWYDTTNLVQAQHCYELGEQILREAGIITGTARAYLRFRQSYVSWQQGSYESALFLAQEALTLFAQVLKHPKTDRMRNTPMIRIRRTLVGDPVDLGRTHVLLAVITGGLGRYNDSLGHLNRALPIFEQYHCQREIAITCYDLGEHYLKKADYIQAESALHRSLSLAELMGDIPLITFVLGNLGLLQIRSGKLVEAETILRRGITLNKQLNDPYAATTLYISLAMVLQEQGRVDEASRMLCRALRMSSTGHATLITDVTRIALGRLRIEQATGISNTRDCRRIRLLMRARNTLQRALAMRTLEAETRIEGSLALTQGMFLEGNVEAARQQALQTLETACQLELMWLVPHVQCLLGRISAALGQDEQADQYFSRAMQGFQTYGMRLAYGRTLQHYGQFLRLRGRSDGKDDQQGQAYLHEACEIFRECHARRDLQRLEQMLGSLSDTSTQKFAVESHSSTLPAS